MTSQRLSLRPQSEVQGKTADGTSKANVAH